jgi:hypothetical protein
MSDKQTFDEEHNQQPCYEIRLKGLTITLEENGSTLLSVPLADQAALHGILKKVRDLGLTLLSVNSVEPDTSTNRKVKPA